jgi:CelD/BcsL family acetyltransferase involved in cellulose biosynthesis
MKTAIPATEVWTADTHRDDDSLTGIRAEWDDLFARCRSATPFQSHAWLESWWRTYGVPGRLRLVLVRRDGRLVAGAALMRERRGLCTVLTPLGGALADFADALVDDEVAAAAAPVLAAELLRQRDWQAIDFAETRPDAFVGLDLRAAWPGAHLDLPASLCLELAASPMEDLVRDLPSHAKKTVRRRLNQMGRLDLDVCEVGADEADRAVADLLRLHAQQWQGRGVNRAHLRPEFAAHLGRAVPGMIAAGQAVLLEYRIGGRHMGSNLVVVGPDLAGGYLYGADPQLRDMLDVTTLLISTTLPLAHKLGCATMSMLRGAEPYKLRWRPREMVNRRLLLARPGSARALTYTAVVRARSAALRTAKARLPWLRTVRDTARRLAAQALTRRGSG